MSRMTKRTETLAAIRNAVAEKKGSVTIEPKKVAGFQCDHITVRIPGEPTRSYPLGISFDFDRKGSQAKVFRSLFGPKKQWAVCLTKGDRKGRISLTEQDNIICNPLSRPSRLEVVERMKSYTPQGSFAKIARRPAVS